MKKLLIVDDQEEVCRLLEIVLQDSDRQFRTAVNGEEALRQARSFQPDLVLLDIMMPGGIDGLEVARTLRNEIETFHGRILIITAKAQQGDREEAFLAGADDFITKPFDVNDLQKRVASLL